AKETSLSIDPGFLGRDPLAELIEESARFGLVVMPWFEYGFIGGYSGYYPGVAGQGPLFDRHPEWLARTRAGLTGFTAPGGLFYWMSQTNPEVRQFLIRLVEEVAQSYQIVGIQFDRARYP
ncbi:MAG: family 10 glycosylhydrolase, partial [bacterium]